MRSRKRLTAAAVAVLVGGLFTFVNSSHAGAADKVVFVAGPAPVGLQAGAQGTLIEFLHVGSATGPAAVGRTVSFRVSSGPDVGQRATVESSDAGVAVYRFSTDRSVPAGGVDVIKAWLDFNGNGHIDLGEPSNTTSITVLPSQNLPPVADDVRVDVPQGEATLITLPGRDPEGQRIGFSVVTPPVNGVVDPVVDGPTLRYTPNTGFSGADSLTYRVTDSAGQSADGRVDITVVPAPPLVASFEVTPDSGRSPVTVVLTDTTPLVPGVDIRERLWTLGDGTSGAGATASHTYLAAGDFTVRLEVRDTLGRTFTTSRLVRVSAPSVPPVSPPLPTCDGKVASIVVPAGAGVAFGTDGPDVILARSGSVAVYGLGGDDLICIPAGDNVVFGGSGNDTIVLGDGDDMVFGGDGDDSIRAGKGANVVYAGAGNDHVRADRPPSVVYDGEGDDVVTPL